MGWKTAAIVAIITLTVSVREANAQACAPLPSGAVGWWPGDGTPDDLILGNSGLWQGFEAYNTGLIDLALSFGGNDFRVAHTAALSPTTAITVEAWINRSFRYGDFDPLIKMAGEGFNQEHGYALEYLENGVAFYVYLEGIGWQSSGPVNVSDGVWTHVAGVFDGSAIRLYVNGDLARSPYLVAGVIAPSSNDLLIGQDPSNLDRILFGRVDEAMIFNRALSSNEILAQYQAGTAGTCRPGSVTQTATIHEPIDGNGGSVFNVKRGVVPVKFSLESNGLTTCDLPPATIALFRTAGDTLGAINESEFTAPSDVGVNFRVSQCHYMYNLASNTLGRGTYLVQISIDGHVVGTASFSLK